MFSVTVYLHDIQQVTIVYLDISREVSIIWKNLLDYYCTKIKSGSPGEPVDEKAASW